MDSNYHKNIINDLIQWIERNYDEIITTRTIAQRAGFSLWYTQRLFKKHTGVTLGRYIKTLRLGSGVLHLLKAKQTVIDIALQCGYDSSQSFIRSIKNYTGLTPGEIKRLSERRKKRLHRIIEADLQFTLINSPIKNIHSPKIRQI
ncbi:TPA: helix-turn-helix domain-containing protein [Providencia rettgeri]